MIELHHFRICMECSNHCSGPYQHCFLFVPIWKSACNQNQLSDLIWLSHRDLLFKIYSVVWNLI